MLALDDPRWNTMKGGYRVRYDPRHAFEMLASGDVSAAWDELWQELHHQGDVGEVSYAAVPHLVRIHKTRGVPDWNTHALTATIELERGRGSNPAMPAWLREAYRCARSDLGKLAMDELVDASEPLLARSLLATITLEKGLRNTAELVAGYDEEEIAAIRHMLDLT